MSGTRPDNLAEAMTVVGTELARISEQPATDGELVRAKENLKGRVVLALESTGARMNRLGSELLAGAPLLSLDEVVERIDAVSQEDLAGLVEELWAPGPAVGGRDRTRSRHGSTKRAGEVRRVDGRGRATDPRRGRRCRRADGRDGLRGRWRARRIWNSSREPTRRSTPRWPMPRRRTPTCSSTSRSRPAPWPTHARRSRPASTS